MMEGNYCYHIGVDCTAPNTSCPHWQGTFCELDIKVVAVPDTDYPYVHKKKIGRIVPRPVVEPDTNDPSQYPACLDDVADYSC